MTGRLNGKVALVTGGASGLGLAIVERFAAEGAQVVCADIQDEAGAAIEARLGGAVLYRRCDVVRPEQIEAAMAFAAERFGGLDIVVNNAGGTGTFARVDEVEADAFDATMALLLRSVVMGVRYAAPHLRARGGGAILNMASAGGLTPGATRFAYATAKAAVIHFSKEAALQLAPDLIRVNAIAPGMIPTSHVAKVMGATVADAEAVAAKMQPLPVAGRTADVAEAALYLAADCGRFVTGIVLPVDGASSAGRR